tara:strand:+ start:22 stop:825 length:804 start_codon:yes stop_codon:yes gene_type:complete
MEVNRSFLNYIKGFVAQKNVVKALIYREMIIKKNYSFLGFFGVILEPLISTFLYLIILKLIRAEVNIGIDPILFFATGILIFSFFMSVVTRSISSIEANNSLFYYRKVKPIDTIIARTLVELFLFSLLYGLIIFFVYFLKNEFVLDNFPLLTLILFLVNILSFSFGLLMCVFGFKFELTKQIIPILSRPFFFTSGAIFSISIVPDAFKGLILWNPLLHASELARHFIDERYFLDNSISIFYLIKVSICTFILSILLYMSTEKDLLKR